MTKDEENALKMVAEHGVIIYETAIARTGSIAIAKDMLNEYYRAVLYGRKDNDKKWMM